MYFELFSNWDNQFKNAIKFIKYHLTINNRLSFFLSSFYKNDYHDSNDYNQ